MDTNTVHNSSATLCTSIQVHTSATWGNFITRSKKLHSNFYTSFNHLNQCLFLLHIHTCSTQAAQF